ncbi:hypothetical protein D3C78_918090 [compost metagenome]
MRELAKEYSATKKPDQKSLRTIFKDFAHNPDFLKMANGPANSNPYRLWVRQNAKTASEFRENFVKQLKVTLAKGFGVDAAKLTVLD